MTDFTWHHRRNILTSGLGRIAEEVSFYLNSLHVAIRAHNAYEDLSMMSDADLARRGLARREVPAHVMRRFYSGRG